MRGAVVWCAAARRRSVRTYESYAHAGQRTGGGPSPHTTAGGNTKGGGNSTGETHPPTQRVIIAATHSPGFLTTFSRASVLETLLTVQTRLVLPTATHTEDSCGRTVAEG